MQLGIVSYGDSKYLRSSDFQHFHNLLKFHVIRFLVECGKKGSPGVYMRVASFLPWIEKHTQV